MEGLIFGILRQLKIETVQCSFLWFRPSGDRVLPLSMKYVFLALRRGMLRVGCNSSRISSMSAIDWRGKRLLPAPTPLPPGGTAAVALNCVEWIVCCLSMFFTAFTKCAFSFTDILFFTSFTLDHTSQLSRIIIATSYGPCTINALATREQRPLATLRKQRWEKAAKSVSNQRVVTSGTLRCLSNRSTHRKLRKKKTFKIISRLQDFIINFLKNIIQVSWHRKQLQLVQAGQE